LADRVTLADEGCTVWSVRDWSIGEVIFGSADGRGHPDGGCYQSDMAIGQVGEGSADGWYLADRM